MLNKKLCDLFCTYPSTPFVISILVNGKSVVAFVGLPKKIVMFTSVELDNSNVISYELDSHSDCVNVCVEFDSFDLHE